MKRHLAILLGSALLTGALGLSQTAFGQADESEFRPSGSVWGYVFGDAFHKAAGDTMYWGRGQYASVPTGMQGGQLRRLYLGYDYRFSPRFSSRVLLEADDSFLINGAHGVYVKLGYLEWKGILPNASLNIGLIPTPVFTFPERQWGYRSVEKEALNLRGLGRSVDQGVSLSGSIGPDGINGYTLMVGNGSGNRVDADRFLEYSTSLYTRLLDRRLTLEAMGNYKYQGSDRSRTILRGFAGFDGPGFRLGGEVAQTIDRNAALFAGAHDVRPLILSGFASAALPFISDDLNVFVRYDYFDPDTNHDEGILYRNVDQFYREGTYITGLHYRVADNVNIMPNVWVNTYSDKRNGGDEMARRADVVLRTTIYFVFR
jgi:hypothetical protein